MIVVVRTECRSWMVIIWRDMDQVIYYLFGILHFALGYSTRETATPISSMQPTIESDNSCQVQMAI